MCTPELAPGLYRDRYLGGGFRVSGGRRHTVGATRVRIAILIRTVRRKNISSVFPGSEVYRLTGIQIMNFNSVFQLFRAKKEGFGPLEAAEEILFMPDLLSYLLTGKKVCEYTDASTSGLLNPVTKEFEASLLEAAGVAPSIMRPVVMPGTFVGELTDALARETGIGKVPVIAAAGHDTASAVAAVPAADREFAYEAAAHGALWGSKRKNRSSARNRLFCITLRTKAGRQLNARFLKNITGMWLLEQCRKEWEKAGRDYSYPAIVSLPKRATPFRRFVNPDDPRFANPPSMTEAIKAYCRETGQPEPVEDDEFIRCIFESLAFRYKEVLALLSEMAPFPIRKLHVIGGGSMNNLLNQFYGKCNKHAGCGRAFGGDGNRQLHGAGEGGRIGGRPLGDAPFDQLFPFAGCLSAGR